MSLSKSALPDEEPNCQHFISVCGICLSIYEVPKGLPCLHSFCLECIREWAAHKKEEDIFGNQTITCPNCRKECELPATGVDGLPTNFYITERNQDEKSPACKSCDNVDCEIVARCYECGFVCKDCLLPHKSMRALKDHAVIELDKLRIGKVAKQLGNLEIGGAKKQRMPGRGAFKIEKEINMKLMKNNYMTFCCAIRQHSASTLEVAVPNFYDTSGSIRVVGIDGKLKLNINTGVGLDPGRYSQAWGVAVNSDGHFYITDSNPWVKVHDNKGQFLHLFQPFDTSGVRCTEGAARGIVIDSKQRIIVGMEGIKEGRGKYTICISQSESSYVISFEVQIEPYFLAVTLRDTILVSSFNEKPVLEIDYSGKVINTITSPMKDLPWKPRGVCCSKDGEILVVNAAKDKCSVCRFTDSWQYTGCVVSDLEDPRGIAISEDGEVLVVIDPHFKVKIFRRA